MKVAVRRYFEGIHRMKYPLGVLIALVIADGFITHFLVTGGLGREGNPFLQSIIGEQSFFVIKILGSLFCALVLWDIYKRQPKMALICSMCFVSIYSVIVIWNMSIFFVSQI